MHTLNQEKRQNTKNKTNKQTNKQTDDIISHLQHSIKLFSYLEKMS